MFLLVRFLSFAYTSTIHGKTLLLFPHLLQAVSDLRFCSLIEILKLTTNHFSIRISRKRISILLNISANRLKFLKAGVNKTEHAREELNVLILKISTTSYNLKPMEEYD